MKLVTTEVHDGIFETRTDPDGPYWLWEDRRRTDARRTTLRRDTCAYANVEVAEFNSMVLTTNPNLAGSILTTLNERQL